MIQIKSSEGKAIFLPSIVAEIRLSSFISYTKEMEKFDDKKDNHILVMARALSELTGADIQDFLSLPLKGDGTEKGRLNGLIQIFGYYSKVLSEFTPSAGFFTGAPIEYKGKKYHVPARLYGQMSMTTITAAQAVEVLEAQRIIQATIEKQGDETGSLLFTSYCTLLAALLRMDGEIMPTEDMAREAFIRERTAYFADITMDVALNLDFFLPNFTKPSAQTPTISGFLMARVFEHLALGTLTQKGGRLMWQKQGQRKRSAKAAGAR